MVIDIKDHARIRQLLAAYGSDVARWPAAERARVQHLTEKQRKELMRADAALDRLLAKASDAADAAPAPDALMNRILASAPSEAPGSAAQAGRVVPFEPRRAQSHSPTEQAPGGSTGELFARPSRRASPIRRDSVATAALLAASLVLGLFVGSMDRIQTQVLRIGDLAGVTAPVASSQLTVLDEALRPQDDEELL
jgi:hypothetical protein